jgi:hypothetical protein
LHFNPDLLFFLLTQRKVQRMSQFIHHPDIFQANG